MQQATNERAFKKRTAKTVIGRPASQGFTDEREDSGKGTDLDFTFNKT